MSEFQLEPWEVPPGVEVMKEAPFVSVGPLAWKGAQMMFSLKLVPWDTNDNIAFFRANNRTTNYVILSAGGLCKPSLFASNLPQTEIARHLKEALKGKPDDWMKKQFSFGRIFYLEGELCIVRGKEIGWLAPLGNLIPFRVPFNTAVGPSSRLFEWLQTQWRKPKSEVRFAYNWNRLSEEEEHEFYCQRVPRWREIHELMRCVVQLEGLPIGQRWWLEHIDWPEEPEAAKRLEQWGVLLHSHFGTFWSGSHFSVKSPQCLLQDFDKADTWLHVKGVAASSHERLEARLRLRQWLERNAPNEVERLLPK